MIVKLSAEEVTQLLGIGLNYVGDVRPGSQYDVRKILSELNQLRAKKGELGAKATELRAVADLLDAVAPSFQQHLETKADGLLKSPAVAGST